MRGASVGIVSRYRSVLHSTFLKESVCQVQKQPQQSDLEEAYTATRNTARRGVARAAKKETSYHSSGKSSRQALHKGAPAKKPT